jgi:hypothetical protein
MSSNQIPGVPEGWELVRIGPVGPGEFFVDYDGQSQQYTQAAASIGWVTIIRKIEKPARYRPFASAEEFKPHRDRWVSRAFKRRLDASGMYRPFAYDDSGIWTDAGKVSYQEMFKDGRVFEDGTPFGVKIDE